ncbi:glycoside hydrolase family 19 protein [Deinococcus wulumuqiensis]|uniref:glycoside hydrolase family 19 protein n=1 Tax=Deinococcus wulumuqiensis TaxID=980427 RepID=UPI00242B5BC7|nr:glycoside hydrolase family 19 protein [Deinococcus wulumuqiensis]
MITANIIQRLGHSGMSRAVAEQWARGFQAACARFGIDTPLREAHLLAQVMHESCGLKYAEEVWGPTAAQRRYEGRRDLGNVQPGDGARYKGRGPIQLTGRHNYRLAGQQLGLPLEQQPHLAALPENGALIAGWYWQGRQINRHADLGPTAQAVELVSAAVNGRNRKTGKPNGLADRQARFGTAWKLLSAQPPAPTPGRVLLVPMGGGEPVPWNGRAKFGGQDLVTLVPQLQQVYASPGGPWEYGGVLRVWRRQNGDLVLERLPVTPGTIPATPPK